MASSKATAGTTSMAKRAISYVCYINREDPVELVSVRFPILVRQNSNGEVTGYEAFPVEHKDVHHTVKYHMQVPQRSESQLVRDTIITSVTGTTPVGRREGEMARETTTERTHGPEQLTQCNVRVTLPGYNEGYGVRMSITSTTVFSLITRTETATETFKQTTNATTIVESVPVGDGTLDDARDAVTRMVDLTHCDLGQLIPGLDPQPFEPRSFDL
mmetsp:Transcript_6229/g.19993  ORF Transcript_6229/g.19993 Transcript_6229/m.19993 type:complete len:216 (+) Transcript_6229:88-735(+)